MGNSKVEWTKRNAMWICYVKGYILSAFELNIVNVESSSKSIPGFQDLNEIHSIHNKTRLISSSITQKNQKSPGHNLIRFTHSHASCSKTKSNTPKELLSGNEKSFNFLHFNIFSFRIRKKRVLGKGFPSSWY